MTIYEAIGIAWVILTSLLATAAILYLAYVGLRTALSQNGATTIQIGHNSKLADDLRYLVGIGK